MLVHLLKGRHNSAREGVSSHRHEGADGDMAPIRSCHGCCRLATHAASDNAAALLVAPARSFNKQGYLRESAYVKPRQNQQSKHGAKIPASH